MATNTDSLNIQAYEYTGYASQITDMKSYFEENMKLLDEDNREALFKSGNSTQRRQRMQDSQSVYTMMIISSAFLQ